MIKVNAMGDACPIPVVKTKNAIRELQGGGTVETLVDNEIAVQNLTKMANQKGYDVHSEKVADNEFKVTMTINAEAAQIAANSAVATIEEENCPITPLNKKNTVVVIRSNQMGNGEEELGKALLKGFIYALSQQDTLPSTILFYNSGAYITCEESASIEDLKSLEAQGVEILTCGTCLNFYGLTDKLQVGDVTNMYVIAEKMTQADLMLRKKKPAFIIAFDATTQAMATDKLCAKNGLPGRLIPVPREITAGCGFAWKAAPEDETILIEALTKEGIEWASTHILEI